MGAKAAGITTKKKVSKKPCGAKLVAIKRKQLKKSKAHASRVAKRAAHKATHAKKLARKAKTAIKKAAKKTKKVDKKIAKHAAKKATKAVEKTGTPLEKAKFDAKLVKTFLKLAAKQKGAPVALIKVAKMQTKALDSGIDHAQKEKAKK